MEISIRVGNSEVSLDHDNLLIECGRLSLYIGPSVTLWGAFKPPVIHRSETSEGSFDWTLFGRVQISGGWKQATQLAVAEALQ